MYVDTSVYTLSPVYSIILNISSVISIVCLWKIFEEFGQAGWKALIPCYSTLILGRCCKKEDKGRMGMMFELTALVSMVAFLIFTLFLVAIGSSSNGSGGGVVAVFMIISFFIMCSSAIASLVYNIQIKSAFVKMINEASWLTALWVLIPVAGNVYVAFFRKEMQDENQDQIVE